jgi:hypothetical protein
MKTWFKIVDIIIIFLVSAFVFFSVYYVYMKPQSRSSVLIRAMNNEWIFPIDAEERIIAAGPVGDTVIRISENKAWIEFSPCINQTCVTSGLITKQGQWAACLPNNILLIIQGDQINQSNRINRVNRSAAEQGLSPEGDIDVIAW